MFKAIVKQSLVCGLLLIASLLSACAGSGSPAPVENSWDKLGSSQNIYIVQPGDTIYSVAWRFNIRYQSLAAYNGLAAPYTLRPSQKLKLTGVQVSKALPPKDKPLVVSPTSTPAPQSVPVKSSEVNEQGHGHLPWPLRGKIIEDYGQNGNKGIDIAVAVGTDVKVVDAGTVVYSGNNLHGYGQLIIVKHNSSLMTAYAHNSKLLVKEGSKVASGQVIALSGDSEASQAMLHFEVRQAGRPVNPKDFLS